MKNWFISTCSILVMFGFISAQAMELDYQDLQPKSYIAYLSSIKGYLHCSAAYGDPYFQVSIGPFGAPKMNVDVTLKGDTVGNFPGDCKLSWQTQNISCKQAKVTVDLSQAPDANGFRGKISHGIFDLSKTTIYCPLASIQD